MRIAIGVRFCGATVYAATARMNSQVVLALLTTLVWVLKVRGGPAELPSGKMLQ